jgi:hypothetical protein
MRRILSIDGGGIKGVFPASFLATVEEAVGRNIADYFDLIVGTLRIPAMPITHSDLMAITIPRDADHRRSEATLGCSYHAEVIAISQSFCCGEC